MATDWCVRFHQFVSLARFRNLLRTDLSPLRPHFGEFAATVNAIGRTSWPADSIPLPHRLRDTSRLENFGRAALPGLRLRAMFGIGARAEIIRHFVMNPTAAYSAADLVPLVSYTKRNVADELRNLQMAAVLTTQKVRNSTTFELRDTRRLVELLEPTPVVFPDWPTVFLVLHSCWSSTAAFERTTDLVRAVEAHHTMRCAASMLARAGLLPPPLEARGTDVWPAFERLALRLVEGLAGGDVAVFRHHLASTSGERHSTLAAGEGGAPARA